MAQHIATVSASGQIPARVATIQRLWILRLIVGWGIVMGGVTSLFGTSWDIQWHSFIGRDRTLIPPHQMMLAGVTIAGLLAISAVLIETFWVKRNPHLAPYSTSFSGFFSGSVGAFVTGFAALNAAIAFPLDSYWHSLYGIDVAIWAPFHIMILIGMALVPLGGAYLLKSSAQLASQVGPRWAVRLNSTFLVIALGTTMGLFTLLLSDALNDVNVIKIGSLFSINLFPVLAGFITAFTLSIAKSVLPSRFSATYVLLTYLICGLLFSAFVPPATHLLVELEGLQYRGDMGEFTNLSIITMVSWPLMPILVAPLIDLYAWLAKRGRWSQNRLIIGIALIALLASIPVFILMPTVSLLLAAGMGVISVIVSLLFGLVGTYVGTRVGYATGKAMQQEGGEQHA